MLLEHKTSYQISSFLSNCSMSRYELCFRGFLIQFSSKTFQGFSKELPWLFGKELCVFEAVQACTLNIPVIALLEIPICQDPQLCSVVDLNVSPAEFGPDAEMNDPREETKA